MYLKLFATVLTIIFISQNCHCASEGRKPNPTVTVKEGKLKGAEATSVDGTSYFSFKGIPYAQPPLGELRFRAPLPPQPWKGIRDAIEHGPVCPQYDQSISQLVAGSEDCLFVNVYTKSLNPKDKIPVMVFIHGGSYSYNSGNSDTFSPDLLLQHDVILVTMNYRLELLGYLALDTPEVPGNAGMKDQVAALRWIKTNIAKFGGDPDNITIFGESSGASSVTYHMLSPMAKGLFNKVIAESGTCIHDWAIGRDARNRAFRAGRILGKDAKSTRELLQFLRSVKPLQLANLTESTLTPDEKYRGLPETFVPVIETKFKGVEAFIDEDPVEMMAKGKYHKVPIMLGYNSAEGIIIVSDHVGKLDIYNHQPSYYVQREVAEKISKEKLEEFGKRVKGYYVGDKNFTKDDPQVIEKIQSDIHFVYNTHRFAHLYSPSKAPIYMYRFNYDTELNIIKVYSEYSHLKGACHADELFYLFYNSLNKKPYDEQERLRKIAFDVTKLWANFAKSGNPTPDDSFGIKWLPFTSNGKEYLNLEEKMSVGRYAQKERVKFWNKIYKEANVPHIVNCD